MFYRVIYLSYTWRFIGVSVNKIFYIISLAICTTVNGCLMTNGPNPYSPDNGRDRVTDRADLDAINKMLMKSSDVAKCC